MTLCIIYHNFIFLYYFCNNVILFLHMFLQAFENDLFELLASLVESIYLIDGLLMECKSSNTVQNCLKMEKNGLYPMEYIVNLFYQLSRFIFMLSVLSATKFLA